MFGVALERLILVSPNNHIYSFISVSRVRKLNATGDLADIFMLWWDQKFIEVLNSVNLNCDLFVRFKDDGNIIMDRVTDVPTSLGDY